MTRAPRTGQRPRRGELRVDGHGEGAWDGPCGALRCHWLGRAGDRATAVLLRACVFTWLPLPPPSPCASPQRLAWRVDVVTSSKVQTSAQPLTEPTAVIELRTGARLAPTASGVVVFEANRAQLGSMLDEVARIEAVIAKHGGAAHDAEDDL